MKADDSDRHFLLPLPCDEDSPKLFGFWSYEFRVGHAKPTDPNESVWSTAQGRFGAPLVVNCIQQPPPLLTCQAYRVTAGITATASYASAIGSGTTFAQRGGRPESSQTTMWFFVYAQAQQLDGTDFGNVLIHRRPDDTVVQTAFVQASQAHTTFTEKDLQLRLRAYGFRSAAPLSVLAVEMSPVYGRNDSSYADPLGGDLGRQRILRVSPLVPVETLCGT